MVETDNHRLFWLVTLTLGFFVGLFLALYGPNVLHHVLFSYGDTFLIAVPTKANILVGIAALLFCLGCLAMIFDGKLYKVIGTLLLISFVAFIYSGFTYYSVFTDSELTVSTPLSTNNYAWSDIEEAKLISLVREGAEESASAMELTFYDGVTVEITIDPREASKTSRILRHIRSNGVNPVHVP